MSAPRATTFNPAGETWVGASYPSRIWWGSRRFYVSLRAITTSRLGNSGGAR